MLTRTICSIAIASFLVGCAGPTVQVVTPGSNTTWKCDPEPPKPKAPDGGFLGPYTGLVRDEDGKPFLMRDMFAVSPDDLENVLNHVIAFRAAYRTCAATVDEFNKLNKK